MIVAIHQPNYLPWLGYFHKIYHADTFIFFDNTQVPRGGYFNRASINAQGNAQLLTVPMKSSGNLNLQINDCKINNAQNWRKKHWDSIRYSYQKTPYFDKYSEELKKILLSGSDNIADFNIGLIKIICSWFGMQDKKFVLGSGLGANGMKNELLIQMLKKTGATTYLSGVGAKEYMDVKEYEASGIRVKYQEFKHPNYPQPGNLFVPNLSAIDLIFNHGPDSLKILLQDGNDKQYG
jgi:hypothetical protein